MTEQELTLIRESLRAAVNGEPPPAHDSAEFEALGVALSASANQPTDPSHFRILGLAATMALMERQRAVLTSARFLAQMQLDQAKGK